jgi:hypothetical protein
MRLEQSSPPGRAPQPLPLALKETLMTLKPLTLAMDLFVILHIGGCATPEGTGNRGSAPSLHDRIYFFEHRLLPRWTHGTNGAFFDELMTDRTEKLIAAATETVGEEFARGITIRKFPERKAVFLSFPKPKAPPGCFFVYIAWAENGFQYYTYEKTFDIAQVGNKGVVGVWSADGKHGNEGPRKYEDADSFLTEMQGRRQP